MSNVHVVGLVASASELFFIETTAGQIYRMPFDGGTPTPFAPAADAEYLAITTSHLYWTVSTSTNAGVWRVALSGGSPEQIVVVDSTELPTGIAVDEQAGVLYWDQFVIGATVYQAPIGGGPRAAMLAQLADPEGLFAVPGGKLYVAINANRAIVAVDPANPLVKIDVVPATQGRPAGVMADATHLYYTTQTDAVDQGGVFSVPIDGGTPTQLASCQLCAGVAVTETALYWANNVGTATLIMKRAK